MSPAIRSGTAGVAGERAASMERTMNILPGGREYVIFRTVAVFATRACRPNFSVPAPGAKTGRETED
jgi:hypothetical protein